MTVFATVIMKKHLKSPPYLVDMDQNFLSLYFVMWCKNFHNQQHPLNSLNVIYLLFSSLRSLASFPLHF